MIQPTKLITIQTSIHHKPTMLAMLPAAIIEMTFNTRGVALLLLYRLAEKVIVSKVNNPTNQAPPDGMTGLFAE